MNPRTFRGQSRRASFAAATGLVIISAIVAASLAGETALAHEADGHPARIHEGSCEATGRVAYQLTGVGATVTLAGTPIPPPEIAGSAAALPIEVSVTELDAKMTDLTEMPHAIVIYASDEAMDRTLVCGNVGGALMMQMPGMPMPGDELVVWLPPQGDSAYAGVTLLRSEVGGKSTVTIALSEGLSARAATTDNHELRVTPEATPTD